MNNFYASRKTTIIRFIISMLICALSVVLADDNNFRIFMMITFVAIGLVMLIYKLFWDGFDKGTFDVLYSHDNLEKRDLFMRYCGIIVLYGIICTVVLFLSENVIGLIITATAVLIFAIETLLFFKCNKNSE